MNPSQSVLVLEGDDIESFNRAVQQVTYRNSLRFATPGVRPLKLTTSLRYETYFTQVWKQKHAETFATKVDYHPENKKLVYRLSDSQTLSQLTPLSLCSSDMDLVSAAIRTTAVGRG